LDAKLIPYPERNISGNHYSRLDRAVKCQRPLGTKAVACQLLGF